MMGFYIQRTILSVSLGIKNLAMLCGGSGIIRNDGLHVITIRGCFIIAHQCNSGRKRSSDWFVKLVSCTKKRQAKAYPWMS